MDTSFANTQIGPDGRRYPIGHEKLKPRGTQVVDPAEDVPGELPPGVMVNPEVSNAELASVATGMRPPVGADDVEIPEPPQEPGTGENAEATAGHSTSASAPTSNAERGAPTGGEAETAADGEAGKGEAETAADGKGGSGEGGEGGGEFVLKDATKDELIAFAAEQDPPIEVHVSKKVDEVRDEVKAALAERKRS